jgi:hypothetical protein
MSQLPGTPQADGGFGNAIQNVVDGNETVLVGSSISSIFMALCAFGVYKDWISDADVQYLLGIATPLVIVIGVVVRSRVWSKGSVNALQNDNVP